MASRPAYSSSDLDLLEQIAQREARSSFWAFRQYLNPKMKIGWFQRDVSHRLQRFYEDYLAGRRPKLILCSPPQHGKSEIVTDFIAWFAGKQPDDRTIYASFSDRLGIRANLKLQRIFDGERYQGVFPDTRINDSNIVTKSGQTLRNREILEYVGQEGYFRNTTVRGSITGEGLDLGVVDDPIKGREAAQSEAVRENTWDWLLDDFFSRFSEHAATLMILTRWHLDDPAGRLLEQGGDVDLIRYPAIAEEDEEYRSAGEPLFPELKSLDFLLEQKSRRTEVSWQSLYQQNPIVKGGNLFPIDRFQVVDHPPTKAEIASSVRYWDKAGTASGGAYTAGVLMHRLKDGRFVIEDVVRGQWAATDRERRIKATAETDGYGVHVWVEQEPGSGGKESAEATIRNLRGFKVNADRVTGDKTYRADPYAAQVQGGNVLLVRGDWNRAFVNEHEVFPNGSYKDQVDAAAGAFAKLNEQGASLSSWL